MKKQILKTIAALALISSAHLSALAQCVTASSGGSWQNTSMTPQSGTFTATFDATPSASPDNAIIALSNGAQTAFTSFSCLVRFNTSGHIDAYNGTAYAAASTIPFSAGKSYHFSVAVNVSAKTYSITVTPSGGSAQTVGTNYAFRASATSLNNWGAYVDSSGGSGTLQVCNFSTGMIATTYTISASAGTGGSISPSGSVTVNQGATQAFTIAASSGYSISSVTVDGANQGAISSYTFSNVQGNHAISAAFQQQVSEGPYGGTPAGIPGTVQAENYDTGGQGLAYNVSSINGTDNGYRSDGVDLEATSDTGGGVDLGWTTGGQWFKYTVNVATAGTYTVSFRVAGGQGAVTDAFHLSNSSGTNLSGNVNVPNTGGWQTWTTVTASVTLPAGQQTLTLNEDNGGWNINDMAFAAPTYTITASAGTGGSINPSGNVTVNQGANQTFNISANSGYSISSVTVDGTTQGAINSYTFSNVQGNHTISAAFQQQVSEGPYNGTPAGIPGTVQAENYDTGGQGLAYNVSSINGTDNGYRSDGVDLEVTSDTGGGVDLGWTTGGQWFKYTVNVATAGTYTVSFRVAGGQGAVTDAFHLSNSSGTNLSGNVNVPNTAGWQTWTTVTASVTLPAGQQTLTLNEDNGGWNINYMTFALVVQPVAAPTFSPAGGTYTSAQSVTITTTTSGASIRYTTDGSAPTETAGTIYSGPVSISATATLNAIAYESGFTDSPVTSAGYTIASPAAVGATTPFVSYEAEAGALGGGATVVSLTSPPTTQYSSPVLEASGHAYVQLTGTGQYVQWTNTTGQNITAINLRSCIPDAPNGGGIVSTIDLYVNGVFRQAFSVNSQQNYCYEGLSYNDQTNKNPSAGDPRDFWNDTHAFITGAPVAPGSTIRFQKDAANSATFYYIDVIDVENPPPPLTQPANSLSITSYGAVANNSSIDNTSAINNCFSAAQAQGKIAWIPAGTFYFSAINGGLQASGITIQAAGPWYSTLYRVTPPNNTQGVANIINATSTVLENVSLDCNGSSRAGNNNNGAVDFSGSNWLVNNVWIQHVTSSFWCAGDNGMAENCRTLSVWSDGGNFNNVQDSRGIGTNLTYFNNFVRGTGDDAMAINSVHDNGGTIITIMSNITYANNTAVAPWGGKCIGIYGGSNITVKNNLLSDTARYLGLGVMKFGVDGSDLLSATVTGNTVLRCGGNGYNQQQQAVMIGNGGDGQGTGTVENAYVGSNTITDALYDGVGFSASLNVVLADNTINSPGLDGIAFGSSTIDLGTVSGDAILLNNTVNNLNSGRTAVALQSSTSYQVYTPTSAASFNAESGVQTENCSEGGLDVGFIINGSYTVYNQVNLGGIVTFVARVASAGAGGNIEIHLDSPTGTLIGTCAVPVTGGWQTWTDAQCSITGASGTHNVYLVFTGGGGNLFNVQWFSLTQTQSI